MKDRLIKLIDEAAGIPTHFFFDDIKMCPNPVERIADYLLANGVILPLCKVGDTVYSKNGTPYVIEGIHYKNGTYYKDCFLDFGCAFLFSKFKRKRY